MLVRRAIRFTIPVLSSILRFSLIRRRRKGEKAIDDIDDFGLFLEYCKVNYRCAGFRFKMMFVLVMDQLKNIVIFGALWVDIYMVDTAFARARN